MKDFEWDEAKRRGNVQKHNFDFLDAEALFDGRPVVDIPSRRGDEARVVRIGRFEGHVIAVVWTLRGEGRIRIISARRASDAEERKYRQLFS